MLITILGGSDLPESAAAPHGAAAAAFPGTPIDLAQAETDTAAAAAADPSAEAPVGDSDPDVAAGRVVSLGVTGLVHVDTLLVTRTFRLRVGDTYSQNAVRDGVKALYRLGLFDDINVDGTPTEEGVHLVIRCVESPRVTAVEFTGNRGLDTKKLEEKISGTTNKVANGKTMKEVRDRLRDLYVAEGYPLAEVDAEYLPGSRDADRVLSIRITEHSKVTIRTIQFTGNSSLSSEDLRGEMKNNRQKSFWRKGMLKPELLEEDMARVQTYFQRHGYRDARLEKPDIRYSEDGRFADIVVAVDQGPLYTISGYALEGNTTLSTGALHSLIKFGEGDRYNRQKIDESAGEIGGAYADRGYLYAQVDPNERVDSTKVFVTYHIVEQEPSKVRQISITGNTRTKERVIRRQLYLFPGQKFDRALLIRSQRELFQLGYFQDVGVDFKPIPNSYDVDLDLKVEEKAVGTASAGAGYSSQGGLTGFLELGHPNLFGNGQAVNIRLERGGQTSNLDLSFTEPWFMNRPILFGVDLFNTRYKRDLINSSDTQVDRYDYRRTGGGWRLGRSIPGIAYSRATLNYAFERTTGFNATSLTEDWNTSTVTSGESVTTTNSRVVYDPDPVRIDPRGRSTSSLSLALSRNSTDHPLYPHAGVATSLSGEFAGKLFGGNIDFQKYVLDNRAYFKSPGIRAMKPAFMVRSRAGAVNFYGNPNALRVPLTAAEIAAGKTNNDRLFTRESVELFQLGGTAGFGLRGYDDFSIVPIENVAVRRSIVDRSVTTTVRGVPVATSTTSDTTFAYDTFPGGRYFSSLTLEHQFLITEPLHALFFAEAGGVWNEPKDFRWDSIRRSLGVGVRMEIPLLGLVGFDYAYGFDQLQVNNRKEIPRGDLYTKGGWRFHFLFGRTF